MIQYEYSYQEWFSIAIVIGPMKMGNIAPRAGIEPISLVCQASVLNITRPNLPGCHDPTHAYLAPSRGQCRLLHYSL